MKNDPRRKKTEDEWKEEEEEGKQKMEIKPE